MKKSKSAIALLSLLCLSLVSCNQQPSEPIQNDQSLLKGPNGGNGMIITEFDESWVLACGVDAHMVGWSQFRVFGQPNNRNVSITVFHLVITYTNAAGDEFVWRDVGPDHWYFVGEDLHISMTGRSTGSGVIGHVVFNFTQWQFVQISGYEFGDIDALACLELN
jgi:hypothetical protein